MSCESPAAFDAFRRAHEVAGGHSALARICKCTPPNIKQLLDRGSMLPGQYVLAVEAATGVSRHDLRPDLYPREHSAPATPAGDRVVPAGDAAMADAVVGVRS